MAKARGGASGGAAGGGRKASAEPGVSVTPSPGDERPTTEVLRSIVLDGQELVRKELELARIELLAAVSARLQAAGAAAGAGIVAILGLGFLGLATAAALDNVMPSWAARLVVAVVFFAIAGAAVMFGRARVKASPMAPEETKRTVKEDVEWARAQLRK